MKRHKSTQTFLAQKREIRRLNQLSEERKHRRRAIKYGTGSYTSVPKTLKILQEKIPHTFKIKRNYRESEKISIPPTFSIIENTESALKIIFELVSYTIRKRPPNEIDFDHSDLQNFDIAAEQILDVVTIEYSNARKLARRGLTLRGTLPTNDEANRFIRAIGITKILDVKSQHLNREEKKYLKTLRLFNENRRKLRLAEESVTEHAARRLVEYVNQCLEIDGLKLSKIGTRDLSTYTGELLDNASEHSGTEDWILAGFLDPTIEEQRCEIAIINFGKSFSDTFLELPDGHYTRQFVDPFVKLHENKGLFQSHWTKENLLTVVALQGQVSSKNTNSEDTRGNGTIDLIQFFHEMYKGIGNNKFPAKMAIVSGSTKILFDGTHKLLEDSSGRPVIAFNTANNLNQPPDRKYVRTLNGLTFPGTIVSISFPLAGNVTQKEN